MCTRRDSYRKRCLDYNVQDREKSQVLKQILTKVQSGRLVILVKSGIQCSLELRIFNE